MPVTIINVQRGGPSTGMPTRTQQADLLACAYASHGDTKHVLLFPEDPHECFEFAAAALDLADRLQTPIFLMTDLDIGMNHRLCEPLHWDDARRYDRGKVMTRRRARGRPRLRPLSRCRRRRHSVPHAARHAPDPRRLLHSRHHPRRLCALLGSRARLSVQRRAPDAQVRDRQGTRAAAACARPRETARRRVIYYGSTSPAMDEAFGIAAGAGRARRPACGCGPFRSPPRSTSFIAEHEHSLHRRAEPRRPAAHAAGQRAGNRSRASSNRSCTTTARRSPRASSSRRSPSGCKPSQRRADPRGKVA